jgi:dihydrofolate synthase / folylpolyglutamate synthase
MMSITMNYTSLISKLFTINKTGGIKFGLENSRRLSEALGFPEKKFISIHVAGTNGKGSVVTKIAKGLESSGSKVGLYTSPHISSFRERIRINGEMISENDVVELLSEIFAFTAKYRIPATFFELTTLLAFQYFSQKKVDYAVLETGLGGKLDATNICLPSLCVITSISLEHTDILGNTIEEIAREKAGIIKPNIPVILGPKAPYKFIAPIAKSLGAPCTQIEESFENFNVENNAIAKRALESLGVNKNAILEGIKVLPPCRLETFKPEDLPIKPFPQAVILDVAHNPDGLEHLFSVIKEKYPNQSLRVVCGLSKNKDIPSCLQILKKNADHFHLVEASNGRGQSAEILSHLLKEYGVDPSRIFLQPSIEESVKVALNKAAMNQQILIICGTFFIMSSTRAALGMKEPRDPIDLNESSNINNASFG